MDCADCMSFNGYCPGDCKPKTNADRIRAMTDEELAKLIADDWCEVINCPEAPFCNGNCEIHILEWLRQEVNDD